ncbi:MAG: Outer membrane lipoprotein Omp16 [Calditrichaeota bacterium]|nr:Outer membrane lipoprotein Omp16 [Calditrichota bacterium]
MRTAALLTVLLAFAAAGFLLGCAAKQQEAPPEQIPVDTTGFQSLQPEPEPEPERPDTLPSVEELERRRLEQQRLAEQGAREQERRDREALKVVYFEFDESALTSDAREALRHNAELLRRYPDWSVVIEGHCDERGSTEYNLALGERRAYSAKQYYVDYGIDGGRMRLISYGEERPAVRGTGEDVWRMNRRAVTVVR